MTANSHVWACFFKINTWCDNFYNIFHMGKMNLWWEKVLALPKNSNCLLFFSTKRIDSPPLLWPCLSPLIIFVQPLSWIVAERGSLQHVVTHYCDLDRPFPSCLWQLLFVRPDHLLSLDKISVCLQSRFQQSPSSNLNTDTHIHLCTCQRQWKTCLDSMQHWQSTSLKLSSTISCDWPAFYAEKRAPN